jgi:hypothetical protein
MFMFDKKVYVFIASTLLPIFCYAENTNIFESSYTSIAAKDCTLQDSNPVLEYASQHCKGFGAINVKVIEEDGRQTINLNRDGEKYPLNLLPLGFSKLGTTIEWRHHKGQPDKLAGMIVRLNVSKQGSSTDKVISYLMVSKITTDEVCIVGKVRPLSKGKQNKQARLMAEQSADMPCLGLNDKKIDSSSISEYPTQADYYNQHITDARMTDSDGDGINNYDDICPSIPDPKQEDKDGDQVGDVCDACPNEVAQRYSNGCLSSSEEKTGENKEKDKSEGLLKSLLKLKSSTL